MDDYLSDDILEIMAGWPPLQPYHALNEARRHAVDYDQ